MTQPVRSRRVDYEKRNLSSCLMIVAEIGSSSLGTLRIISINVADPVKTTYFVSFFSICRYRHSPLYFDGSVLKSWITIGRFSNRSIFILSPVNDFWLGSILNSLKLFINKQGFE